MALTFNGTKCSLPARDVPSGFTYPTVTTFDDYEYLQTRTYSVSRSTVSNASEATTLANIFDDVSVGLDKQISDELGLDFDDVAKTVTAWAELVDLHHTIDREADVATGGNQFRYLQVDQNDNFECDVKIYIKVE